MTTKQTFKEADVILIRKNNISYFYAKSLRATKVMRNWKMYNSDGHPIYVARVTDDKFIQTLTWLTLQGLLVNSKIKLNNIPTLNEPHFVCLETTAESKKGGLSAPC